ncbi:DNA phosphorothioation-dependent restriction protein DptG [Brevibacillus dissolubilis]|uniref:DNA phosphorothioation-dependent restriction protein DptG n=1 Tax=Brevibacillus dissolubilis TaxID=1844116 RepID=UPI00111762B2|nr:DNA phosphorothioation-dependent restriction protein DptG [Brevibacillus dissolubilis]
MTYRLNIKKIHEAFSIKSGKSVKHNPKIGIDFLPYTTKKKGVNYQPDFIEVMGEFSRLVECKASAGRIDIDSFFEQILGRVDLEEGATLSDFKKLLKTLFFSEERLHLFHPKVLSYMETIESENKKLALFLYQVLNASLVSMHGSRNHEPKDVLTRLVFDSLPQLQDGKKEDIKYQCVVPEVSDLFAYDFNWLSKNPQLFVESIGRLLTYYYFFYVTQFALHCFEMFQLEQSIVPVYFTLDWENLSQSRVGYERGWNHIEKVVSDLFSHVNTLKMLSLTDSTSISLLSYQDIKKQIDDLYPDEREELYGQLNRVLNDYKETVTDVRWEEVVLSHANHQDKLLDKISEIHKIIRYQFKKTRRKSEDQNYYRWFTQFCGGVFLKNRGRLGKALNLNADYLLFLTKLIMKDEPRIRLVTLFEEFKRRGIIFDRDSEQALIEYFEGINILVKKSDSGDALYVKSFL